MTYHFECVDVYIINKLSSHKMDYIVIIIKTSLSNITIVNPVLIL